jgi:hypothetical protein
MKRLEAKVTTSEAKVTTSEAKIATLETEVDGLKIQVKDLTLSSEGYRSIRNRFIEVYRRDVIKNITKEGYEMIGNSNEAAHHGNEAAYHGNEAAHHGDVIADSAFYLSYQRYEEDTFFHIYRLSATQLKLFGKSYPLFLVISLHYTL